MITVKLTLRCDRLNCDGTTEVEGFVDASGRVDFVPPPGWNKTGTIILGTRADSIVPLYSCPRPHNG